MDNNIINHTKQNRTALITGGSRGIGRAIALELAKQGYRIVINYKDNHDAAIATAKEVLDLGVRCDCIKCDVRHEAEVKLMRQQIKDTFGGVDILVANAGVAKGGLLQDTQEIDYDYIMDTNLKGVYNTCKVFVPDMIANQWGRIVSISSIWGLVGGACETIYSASKAGVIGFSKALAKELAPSGITVNCIAPGAILTDMLKQLPQKDLDWLSEEIPMGRIGAGEDVANTVCHLVKESSSYITGQVINISGGFTIN